MAEDTWEAEVLWPLEYERAKEAAVAEATARVRAYWESKLEQMSKTNRWLSLMKDRREAERDSLAAELRLARQYEADLRAELRETQEQAAFEDLSLGLELEDVQDVDVEDLGRREAVVLARSLQDENRQLRRYARALLVAQAEDAGDDHGN